MQGIGTSKTRGISVQALAPVDTLRFSDVVAYSADGIPTLVTFDFSKYDIANVRIWRSIFDSATKVTMEIRAAGPQEPCDPPTPCFPPSISQMSIRETRMGADVVIDEDGTGGLPPHGGNGILVNITSDTAGIVSPGYIKTLDISNNLFIGKQGTDGYFVRIDSPTSGRIRAAQVVGNTFGEAIAAAQGRMPGAVWLGADNIMVSGNILHNARESDAAAPVRVDHFARTTRPALLNTVLIGNSSSVPLGVGFLDEAAGALGPGKQNLANTGQVLAFVQDAQLTAEQTPVSTAST